MHQRRPILVGLLLAIFLVGGVAGPSLHRAQHGAAQIAEQAEEPCHAPKVHQAEGAVWVEAAVDLAVPDCVLCTTRLLVVPSAPVLPAAPRALSMTVGAPGAHVALAPVAIHHFIRGPPSWSEAHSS
jgi:hypothetical protein